MTRTILLIGATDGLGRALATEPADLPDADLILHGRDQQRLEALAADLRANPTARVRVVRADLAVMSDVHRLADEIGSMTGDLSVLVDNAGVGARQPNGDDVASPSTATNSASPSTTSRPLLSPNGYCRSSTPVHPRIVNVTSIGQAPVALDDPTLTRGYSGIRAYGQSKLAMMTTGFTLAARLDATRRDATNGDQPPPRDLHAAKMFLESVGHSISAIERGSPLPSASSATEISTA